MNAESSDNTRIIFTAAAEIEDAAERAKYLDEACADDTNLRAEVEDFLRRDREAGSFLNAPAVGIAPTIDTGPATEQLGTTIGRYKLVHEMGQGGMGMVYMAVQKEPVKRKVALKVIKPGMGTREVVARFEAERQALALMNHPSIATVHDGGTTESGRPYFVMELVVGTPITEYCDEYRYTTRQRLELFTQVCDAVQHAHQKGVIHRDIKPSNILVTNDDHKAVPKVIDFGIAKAVHQLLTDQSLYTHATQMIGTPLYMSPEQAHRTGRDVDTRTDVYSLGVLLYELLTGTLPFDKERLQTSGMDEFKRIIREEEPPKPSTRLSTVDAALETVADKHSTDLRTLTHELSGELDWIVMKSLEKDRTRRYESANDLAKDIQRYLNDEPVEACPPSTAYQLKKFARRNKAVLSTILVVFLTMAVGLGGTTWQAIRATRAEGLAGERLTEVDQQRKQAERNYDTAREAVRQMLTRVADEELAKIPEMKEVRRCLLEDAAAFYTQLLKLNPRDPQAYHQRGRVYYLLQQYNKVRADYEKAIELDPDKAEFHADLAWFLSRCPDVAYRDLDVALLQGKWAVRLAPRMFQYHGWLAVIYRKLGRPDEAMAEGQELIALNPGSADAYGVLRAIRLYTGDLQGALECARKEVELAPDDCWHHTNLAGVYSALGKYEDAIAAVTKAIAVANKTRSESSDGAAFYEYVVRGDAYTSLKMYEQALADYDKAVELGPFRSFNYKRRGLTHFHLENYDQALADIAKAVELLPDDWSNLVWIPPRLVAECPDDSFRVGLLRLADKTIEMAENKALAYAKRGRLHDVVGQYDLAIADYHEAIRLNTEEATDLADFAWLLVTCPDTRLRNVEQAVQLAEKAVNLSPQDRKFKRILGAAQYRKGDWEAARETLEQSLKLETGQGGPERRIFLAMTNWQLGNRAEARKYHQDFASHVKRHGPDREDFLRLLAEAEELMGPIDVEAAEKKPQDEPEKDTE